MKSQWARKVCKRYLKSIFSMYLALLGYAPGGLWTEWLLRQVSSRLLAQDASKVEHAGGISQVTVYTRSRNFNPSYRSSQHADRSLGNTLVSACVRELREIRGNQKKATNYTNWTNFRGLLGIENAA